MIENAVKLYMSVSLLDYDRPDDRVNQEVLGRLTSFVYPCEDDMDPVLDYVTERMCGAFEDRDVKEVLGDLLLEFEHYRELDFYNKLRGHK